MSVGERVAFGEYVRARSGALLRAAQALTANRADAEDLLQATLVKAYQSWDNDLRSGRARHVRPPGHGEHPHLGLAAAAT